MKKLLIITACPAGGLSVEAEADSRVIRKAHEVPKYYWGRYATCPEPWEVIEFTDPVIRLEDVVDNVKAYIGTKQYDIIRHYNTGHGVKQKNVYGVWWGDERLFYPWSLIHRELYAVCLDHSDLGVSVWNDSCYSGGDKRRVKAQNNEIDVSVTCKNITPPALDMALVEGAADLPAKYKQKMSYLNVCRRNETAYGRFEWYDIAPWWWMDTHGNSLGTAAIMSGLDLEMRIYGTKYERFLEHAQMRINTLKHVVRYSGNLKVHHINALNINRHPLI